jgi:hypothetical protein
MPFNPISIGNKAFFHTAPTHLITNLSGESILAHTHFSILSSQIVSLTSYCSHLSSLIESLQLTVNSTL